MGIKTNLQTFMDPDYSGFDQELADNVGSDKSLAAVAWMDAIGPELTLLLAPMLPAFLVSSAMTAAFILTSADFNEDTLPGAIDDAIANAADTVFDAGGYQQAPSDSLDSENEIFDPDPPNGLENQFTPEEICARAENRIIEWLSGGTFTGYYIAPGSPPTGSPGVSSMKWIYASEGDMPPPPDGDGDGYSDAEEIEAETDPESEDEYPDSDD